MGDSSAYYRIELEQLDGSTEVNSFPWTAPTNEDPYRHASLGHGALGIVPLDAFTRSVTEGGNVDPIAGSGAIVVVRAAKASAQGIVAVMPRGTSVLSQYQSLSQNPRAELWAWPGDRFYLIDPGFNPTGGAASVEIFVRPLNYEEIDTYLRIPRQPPVNTDTVVPLTVSGEVPLVNAKRVLYMVTPPAADTVYTLPLPGFISPGNELCFVGTNNFSFILNCTLINGGGDIPASYYVPGRGVVTMMGAGGAYAPIGSQSMRTRTFNSGDAVAAFRGTQICRFNVALAEAFALPPTSAFPNDVTLIALNIGAGNVTLTPTGGTINLAAVAVLTNGHSLIIRPSGANWVGVQV